MLRGGLGNSVFPTKDSSYLPFPSSQVEELPDVLIIDVTIAT